MLGLAIALAISAIVNLVLLINHRNRESLLSAGRWLITRMQAVRAAPNTNSSFPGPRSSGDDDTPQSPPQPPPPPPPPPTPRPAIVWPTVRPSAPPPPPRVLSYGAKGIFETGKKTLKFRQLCPVIEHLDLKVVRILNVL